MDTWTLEADIRGAFDHISHQFILDAIGNTPGREVKGVWAVLRGGRRGDAPFLTRLGGGWKSAGIGKMYSNSLAAYPTRFRSKSHVRNILTKFGVTGRTEAAAIAVRQRLVE